jgi:hypothetical protein
MARWNACPPPSQVGRAVGVTGQRAPGLRRTPDCGLARARASTSPCGVGLYVIDGAGL